MRDAGVITSAPPRFLPFAAMLVVGACTAPVVRSTWRTALPELAGGRAPVVNAPAPIDDAGASEPPLLDAWSLAAREDGVVCRDELKTAGFKFRAMPDRGAPDKAGCGIPHPVVVFRGPTGIAYDPP